MVAVLKYITLLLSGGLGVFLAFYKEKSYRLTEKVARQKAIRHWLIGTAGMKESEIVELCGLTMRAFSEKLLEFEPVAASYGGDASA